MKILTLDLDPSSLRQLQPAVLEMGMEILSAQGMNDALTQIEQQHPDILLMDRETQESTGYAIINSMGKMGDAAQALPVVFITKYPEPAPELEGRQTATITRPIATDDLKAVIGRITSGVRNVNPSVGQVAHLGEYGTMLCHSAAMREVMTMVDQVAGTNITVLVRGESGTGKELVSRTIFQRSLRRDKPFVKVLCAALPEGLLESELFGYERGAFTGAHKRKPGKFEFAHNGTIFLDEIGEVPITLQAKLLQVVQDGEFVRLGGEKDIKVDARIIAATNRDLETCVAAGTFREDLFYRLNVVCVNIPSLSQRMEEVPYLCEFFIEKFSQQYQRKFPTLSQVTMDYFLSYPWPGNIRELENMIKQIVVLGNEGTVLNKFKQFHASTVAQPDLVIPPPIPIPAAAPSMAPATGLHAPPAAPTPPPAPAFHAPPIAPVTPATPAPQGGYGDTQEMDLNALIADGIANGNLPLKEIGKRASSIAERQAILHVLGHTRWNRRKAATILQISYKALLYKIRDYGLNDD